MDPKYDYIILLDWDDTLFPSTWINQYNINLEDSNYKKLFNLLDVMIYNFIIELKKIADIKIISNGTMEWLNKCLKVLPISANKIELISSRDLYSEQYPNQYILWKQKTFSKYVKDYTSIISIGDSICEERALLSLDNIIDYDIKSIKLKERPNVNEIINQIEFIRKNHKHILNNDMMFIHIDDLDITSYKYVY
jgi:hypothetical protein